MSVKNHTDETKLKMSASQKARHARMSEEQKKAISDKLKKKMERDTQCDVLTSI
ncbi:hypothetical protein [Prevotella veroralis]|uniref:Uncharacterized protein n=1 Tax=Prevotella veroralis F0319 TaxID=649761 RepID=C9MPR2_9BACT|nr:hypothetical protein [Prevotella veroralis]EEX18415.1 hypothetical protein HMPREF0973_01603 [Prevotella veroralis F0319]QUB39986.1 hypothetical protein J5A55_04285 [Prevotella veroralis]